ncbi:MAG: thiamine phosphate synthase [Candidatus Omnitrophica bacterium]|nr:thiamine phosphate synthase [Candidatus Omnitrophota bacterium]
MKIEGFYFITDAYLSYAGNLSDVRSALEADVKIVQYRQKHASGFQMYKEALKLRKICKDIVFLINDRVDIALAVDADGVHLGQDDLPLKIARKLLGKGKIIGISVHNLKQAKQAERLGADYISVGPIFPTRTKPNGEKPVGLELIREIKKQVALPLVAIGGINIFNAKAVIASGADSICAISSVVTKKDVRKQIERFQALFKRRRYGIR